MFSIQCNMRNTRMIAASDFWNEAASIAIIFMTFEMSVGLGVVRLEAKKFRGNFFSVQAGIADFLAALSPSVQGILTKEKEPFVFGANSGVSEKLSIHKAPAKAIRRHRGARCAPISLSSMSAATCRRKSGFGGQA
jgi:hypothetical protein